MTKETKQKLISYAEGKGWDADDDGLIEIIIDAKVVWQGEQDRHRW
jgi:hypothetical protein